MIPAESIQEFIRRYGCQVNLYRDGNTVSESYRAFVQPLRYKNKMYLEGTRTPIGYADQSHYLYVGPGSVDVTALPQEAVLTMGEGRFYFSHCEAVRLADETLYMWAILRTLVEEDEAA